MPEVYIGTKIHFRTDGIEGIGTIARIKDGLEYSLSVEVEEVLEGNETMLHCCGEEVPSGRGWYVSIKDIIEVMDDREMVEVSESEMESIIGW